MPQNIEIKAYVEDMARLEALAQLLSTSGPIEIAQNDTFFRCPTGRLKLRVFADGNGELIFYERANDSRPTGSYYIRSESSDPASLRQALRLAYGEVGTVQKRRTLYLAGRTRIHLDRVDGLGNYVELEVVLDEGDCFDQAIAEAHDLMTQLGIAEHHLIDRAYVDLINERKD